MNTQIEETAITAQPITAQQADSEPSAKKRMPDAIRIILCILLSLLLAVVLVTAAASLTVRMIVTEKNIEKIIDNTDYLTIPVTIENIPSNLYELLLVVFSNPSTENADIYTLAEKTNLDDFVAERIYDYLALILYDDMPEKADNNIIKVFYDENSDLIDRAFNISSGSDEIYSKFENYNELFNSLTQNDIEADIPIKLIQVIMTPAALIIMAVLAVILIVMIGIISGSAETPLVITGISVGTIGLAVVIASCFTVLGITGIPTVPVTAESVIWQGFSSTLLPEIFTSYLYILTAGILLVLLGAFVGKIRRNIKGANKN